MTFSVSGSLPEQKAILDQNQENPLSVRFCGRRCSDADFRTVVVALSTFVFICSYGNVFYTLSKEEGASSFNGLITGTSAITAMNLGRVLKRRPDSMERITLGIKGTLSVATAYALVFYSLLYDRCNHNTVSALMLGVVITGGVDLGIALSPD